MDPRPDPAFVDPSFAVLHALRVKGLATGAALARATGLSPDEVERTLESLHGASEVAFREGRTTGWSLTVDGREAHRRSIASEVSGDRGATEAIHDAYGRFLTLDGPFKAICTDWQVRDRLAGAPNDHTDPGYDSAVIDRLTTVHADLVRILDDLVRASPRFGTYRPRLEKAHARVLAGDLTALTTPLAESYHDVWMELHEDLLVTLGVERREGVT